MAIAAAGPALSQGLADNAAPPGADDKYNPVSLMSWEQLGLSLAVLLFGVFVLLIEYRLLSKVAASADSILRTLTVTLIVVVSLALVSSSYGASQITPVLGLFGTIVGYLLSSARQGREP